MGKSCAALGCSNGIAGSKLEDSNISFHKFPLRHPELLAVWTSRTGRRLGAFTPTEHSRLCSRHFLRRDFINPDAPKARRLRDDTIPSVNLPGFPTTDDYVGKECKTDCTRLDLAHSLTNDSDSSKTLPGPIPSCKSAVSAATATLPPSQLRKLAHKQQIGDGSDGQMDPVLRETWEVLASDPDYGNASSGGPENDSTTVEEKIVRIKPQLWQQVMHSHHHHPTQQQQHPHNHNHHNHNHHHHHHHHQHQHHQQQHQSQSEQQQSQQQEHGPSSENPQHPQLHPEDKDLTEEQEQQLEHEERNFRSTGSSSIGTESFSHRDPNRIKLEMNESLSCHDDYQPPAKKPYQPHVDCTLGSLPVSTDASSESAGPLTHFECGTNPSTATPGSHMHSQFDLTGPQHRLLNGNVPTGFPLTSGNEVPIIRPTHREKNTNTWDSLWSEVGKAVRTVADSFAYFLRTKADIARERHQMEMESKGFRLHGNQASKTASKETNTVINVDLEKETAAERSVENNSGVNHEAAESTNSY